MKKAFTLIELLVVIAIVAILAAILFPVFAQAKEAANKTRCLSNEKQLVSAFLMYAGDADDTLPSVIDGVAGTSVPGGWVFFSAFPANKTAKSFDVAKGSLFPYVKSAEVYVCPTDAEGKASGNSYAMNSCTLTAVSISQKQGKSLSQLANSSEWAIVTEEAITDDDAETGAFLRTSSTDDGYLASRFNYLSTRHANGSTLGFLDGHAKWTMPERAYKGLLLSGGEEGNCQ